MSPSLCSCDSVLGSHLVPSLSKRWSREIKAIFCVVMSESNVQKDLLGYGLIGSSTLVRASSSVVQLIAICVSLVCWLVGFFGFLSACCRVVLPSGRTKVVHCRCPALDKTSLTLCCLYDVLSARLLNIY